MGQCFRVQAQAPQGSCHLEAPSLGYCRKATGINWSVFNVYDIVYDIVYDVVYDIVLHLMYDVVCTYDIVYDMKYDIDMI